MMAPWLALPRSLEGLAALEGFLVVVWLACTVVPLVTFMLTLGIGVDQPFEGVMFAGTVLPVLCGIASLVAWDEAFITVSLDGMVVALCDPAGKVVAPDLLAFAPCVVGFIVLLQVLFLHMPICVPSRRMLSLMSFPPSEVYMHGVPLAAVVFAMMAGSAPSHAKVQFW